MQQRQYRPGDVLDDYCPRERRVTDHAIVAMVDNEIQRTRCVSCDAEHEFKNARVPAPRKKSSNAALFNQVLDNIEAPPGRIAAPSAGAAAEEPSRPGSDSAPPDAVPEPEPDLAAEHSEATAQHDDRPFRRSLIRAQLPRPEGQPPQTRAIPEFTMHQPQNLRPRRGGQRFRRPQNGPSEFAGPMRSSRNGGPAQGNPPGNGQGRRRRRKKH